MELIDTCWNVNANSATNTNTGSSELIDTCWNVNCVQSQIQAPGYQELIDTCWNVNTFRCFVLNMHFVN